MEHMLKKVHHKKWFFTKSFIVSLVLIILVCLLSYFCYDHMYAMSEKLSGISTDAYAEVFTLVMGFWKILIIQFTLVPAVAMCMVEKHIKTHEKCDD